jgi:hypothetical protein
VESTLGIDTPNKEKKEETTLLPHLASMPLQSQHDLVQSPSLPREQFPLQGSAAGAHEQDNRRVTFGQSQQRIFHGEQDKNRSVMSTSAQKKKKKKFRGSKLISGVFGKKKKKKKKKKASVSRPESSGMLYPSGSSYSSEWGLYSNNSNNQSPYHSSASREYDDMQQHPYHGSVSREYDDLQHRMLAAFCFSYYD